MGESVTGWWLAGLLMAQAAPATSPAQPAAQAGVVTVHGELGAMVAGYPKQNASGELRARASITATADPKPWLRLRFEGMAEGLYGDRSTVGDSTQRATDLDASVRDAWAEVRIGPVEVRAGHGRVIWGRLDEVMPSDVINPIDTARFFLNGRADARLPVPFVRTRVFLPRETSVEIVAALPGSRSRFDSLEESTSPFNLLNDLVLPLDAGTSLRRETPSASWRNLQGGVRLSGTAGRVDMSLSAWRGFEGFGLLSFEALPPVPAGAPIPMFVGRLVERFPRFTMIAGDAELVRGEWAIRGEVAAFVDRTLSSPAGPAEGRAIDAGIGVDRAAGDYHFFGSLVWHREWFTASTFPSTSHLNVIASVDRRFSRDRYLVRLFGVLNPEDRSGFARGLASWSVRDNLMLEASGGIFLGEGSDTISRFTDRDFLFARMRYSF
jgi:hypothetical protein